MNIIVKNKEDQRKIDEAISFAINAHEGQVRKYTGKPYVTHPLSVARIVQSVTDEVAMIVASILHDTVEDTDVTHLDILHKFGLTVSLLVIGLTDTTVPGDGNREVRRAMDRKRMASNEVDIKTIKIADIIHNLTDGIENAKEDYRILFYSEKRAMLEEALTEGDRTLFKKAMRIIKRFEENNIQNKE